NQTVDIAVEDTAGNMMTDTFIIEVTKTNRPPVTDGIPDQTIAEGETLNLELLDYFEDPDGDNLVFAVISGVGTVIGSEYTYSPNYDAAGTYQVTIKAADGNGGEVETTFTLTVENTNRPPEEPQLVSPENAALLINTTSVELSWNCSDPDGQLLTYDVYFGEDIEALEVIATQSATSLHVQEITAGKTYFWMIVARDPHGAETASEVYSFSTDYYLIPGGEFEGMISGYALMTKANSPYIITGDIVVESGAQLIIEPGVEVRFTYISDPDNNGQEDTNAADLIVYGKLFAEGSETEPLLFTSNETPALKGDWGGIRFASSEGTSKISHATIEMAKDGVWTSS
ncbi:Ig-like domain-containing protein, partial [Mesotoga sp. B105.6.4]